VKSQWQIHTTISDVSRSEGRSILLFVTRSGGVILRAMVGSAQISRKL